MATNNVLNRFREAEKLFQNEYMFFTNIIFIGEKKTIGGRKFREEKKKREILGINFRECPMTTHFASNKLSRIFQKVKIFK